MSCGFSCWFKSLFLLAALFGGLGAMGAYWYFFWQNREMAPCAPVGINGEVVEGVEIVEPYSERMLLRRTATFGAAGVLLGVSLGLVIVGPRSARLRRYERELLEDDPDMKEDATRRRSRRSRG